MTTAQALENVLNAWVNGRKVRDGIPLTIRQQAEQALLTADAQATVEALQRERDFFETAAATANRMRVDTERALDAEREKVKGQTQRAEYAEGKVRELLLEQDRATLDATTPAAKGGDGEPAECTNHFTDGSKIFPSRNCCSKGAK